ncbi:SET domain-containing protein [Maridesulfovibrio sp.]|uniref:SET domain-containing protein n=1 Tax=Maridesulfovibrio sp. TaxID=2795000 RepID=UPI0029C9C51F|nr:SET domain-containing protein [Maridesulfovibrio sp.]
MIHPDTIVRTVSPLLGNGVFAIRDIPCGTVMVVRDEFDICLPYDDFQKLPDIIRESMETHVYHDREGTLVLSWDHARFMNHSCCSNTMMTDYNLEIAIRDIRAGEQITTEYGLLNVQEPYEIHCGCDGCRKQLRPDDIDKYGNDWDELIKAALLSIPDVSQPLWDMVTPDIKHRLEELRLDKNKYSSVQNLKWRK